MKILFLHLYTELAFSKHILGALLSLVSYEL